MNKVPQPYVDPNFSEPPKWVVDVQLKEWRHVPSLQKIMMIQERLMNARTIEHINLAYNLKTNVDTSNIMNNSNGQKSGNQGMN